MEIPSCYARQVHRHRRAEREGQGIRAFLRALAGIAALVIAAPILAQSGPLDRRVVLPLFDVPLREALDRLSVAARVRFSYKAELIPLDRAVRTGHDTVSVRDLLGRLLEGIAVTPVVGGDDHIVLTPLPAHSSEPRREPSIAPTELARVVVTGSPASSPARPLSVSLSVLDREELSRFGTSSLSSIIDGAAPGIWAWDSPSLAGLARYGSIRGASSLGMTYPKVYIDGITVANPLLMTMVNPDNVDRIEIIRGPQGAALYGSDAISGVVNIVMRHDNPVPGGTHLRMRSTAGITGSDYSSSSVAQNHFLSLSGGNAVQSAQGSVGISSLGDFYANTASRRFMADAGLRRLTGNALLTATGQLAWSDAGVPGVAISDTAQSHQGPGRGTNDQQTNLLNYTTGVTARIMSGAHLTHTLVVGLDGYRLENFANDFTPFPSGADSALRAARGAADRTTLRATTTYRNGDESRMGTKVSVALEHSALRQETPVVQLGPGPSYDATVEWMQDLGAVMQFDLSARRQFYFTGGVRLEHNSGYVSEAKVLALPMFGASFVREIGSATVKLRGAYGQGARAPRSAPRQTMLGRVRAQIADFDLQAERQSGFEGGVDVYLGRAFSLQVTRFDQRASDLIQQVIVPDMSMQPSLEGPPELTLRYQNVGSITNRGWELEGKIRRGALLLSGSFSTVDSRVSRIATHYTGELRNGDRVLGVPSRTVGVTAAWTPNAWSLSAGLSRAFDWIEYDRLDLADAYARFDRRTVPLYGADLRGYWRKYDGFAHIRASVSRALNANTMLLLQGENLLGHQRGEPDNATILPGRIVSGGLRITLF